MYIKTERSEHKRPYAQTSPSTAILNSTLHNTPGLVGTTPLKGRAVFLLLAQSQCIFDTHVDRYRDLRMILATWHRIFNARVLSTSGRRPLNKMEW
jgi:hypothetical protein